MKKAKQQSAAGAGAEKSTVGELKPWPAFIQDRLALWDKLKVKYDEELASKPDFGIKITLPDGKIVEAVAWKTTAYDVAKGIRSVIFSLKKIKNIYILFCMYLVFVKIINFF